MSHPLVSFLLTFVPLGFQVTDGPADHRAQGQATETGQVSNKKQAASGIETAPGFVLERMFETLLGEEELPVGLAFDSDGVPFVLVERPGQGLRAILRVDDPGGWGHPIAFHEVASAVGDEPIGVAGLGIEFIPRSERIERTWDGEEFSVNPNRCLVDLLLPDMPLLHGVDAALVIESARWLSPQKEGLHKGMPIQLLVFDAEQRSIRLVELGERGRVLVPVAERNVIEAEENAPFQPSDLIAGPEGQVWIIDKTNRALWRLHREGSSTDLGPVLSGAHGPELLFALRNGIAERRAVARRLILLRKTPVQGQDRALALLDALQKNTEPFAAASLDSILAERGAGLPRSEPVLDGALRERLERHQVRLDFKRDEPLAARRLLSRWLECSARTRLVLAFVLSAHPAATQEEQLLAHAALGLPSSSTRYVALADPIGSDDWSSGEEPTQRFLDSLAPLGVEYVEIVHSTEDLLPRLASAHTIVLGSLDALFTPTLQALLDAFVKRGGGLLFVTPWNRSGSADHGYSPNPEWASSESWVRQTACYINDSVEDDSRGGSVHFVSPPVEFGELAARIPSLPSTGAFRLAKPKTSGIKILIEDGVHNPVVAYRDVGMGRVVTCAMIPQSKQQRKQQRQEHWHSSTNEMIRALVLFAGAGSPMGSELGR